MRTSLLRLALFLEENSVALTAAMVLGTLVGAAVAGADVLTGVLAAALAFAAGVCVGLILPDLLFHVTRAFIVSFMRPICLRMARTQPRAMHRGKRSRNSRPRDRCEVPLAEAAAAFDAAVSTLRILEVDIAAALDEPRQRVADMRRGERPISMEHLVLLHRRMPALFEAYARGLFGGCQ